MRREVNIGPSTIGEGSGTYFIAEAGVNHNGDVALAKKLIEAAKEAGANCVKFQTFKAEDLVTIRAPKAAYQLKVTDSKESQFDMLKKLELPQSAYIELMKHCQKFDIQFLSTPYGFNDADFLENLGVDAFKVASGQLTEYPFLDYLANKKKPIILSTGMASFAEVKEAVKTIEKTGLRDLVLLQCTTNYPCEFKDANIHVVQTFRNEFDFPIGYSDHTVGEEAILGAVALGALVIEKHFSLNRSMPGPDHSSSIEPKELKELIRKIRNMEKALGGYEKIPAPVEIQNAIGMKRSLTAIRAISEGTKIEAYMIGFKRPATGIPPKDLDLVVGQFAKKDIALDTILTQDMISWSPSLKEKLVT